MQNSGAKRLTLNVRI